MVHQEYKANYESFIQAGNWEQASATKISCPELRQGRFYKAKNYNYNISEVGCEIGVEGGCSNSID